MVHRVYEPQIRARLGTTAHSCKVGVLNAERGVGGRVHPPAGAAPADTYSSQARHVLKSSSEECLKRFQSNSIVLFYNLKGRAGTKKGRDPTRWSTRVSLRRNFDCDVTQFGVKGLTSSAHRLCEGVPDGPQDGEERAVEGPARANASNSRLRVSPARLRVYKLVVRTTTLHKCEVVPRRARI